MLKAIPDVQLLTSSTTSISHSNQHSRDTLTKSTPRLKKKKIGAYVDSIGNAFCFSLHKTTIIPTRVNVKALSINKTFVLDLVVPLWDRLIRACRGHKATKNIQS